MDLKKGERQEGKRKIKEQISKEKFPLACFEVRESTSQHALDKCMVRGYPYLLKVLSNLLSVSANKIYFSIEARERWSVHGWGSPEDMS